MRPRNINEVCHEWISTILSNSDIAVDATCGNGNDTIFLAQTVHHVYAFDIQKIAIENTKQKTKDFSNITYILDGHEHIDQYITFPIDICVFNFGYLPKGNESITTQANTSLLAFKKAFSALKENGSIFLTIYIGHPNGKVEYNCLLQAINTLENCIIHKQYTYEDRSDAPILYWIQKQK